MIYLKLIINVFLAVCIISCTNKDTVQQNQNFDRATKTLDAIYSYYTTADNAFLLRENYPYDETRSKAYAYLWTYSGSIPAIIALYESSKDASYIDILEGKILPGLEMYYDTSRQPNAYGSYLNTDIQSDRFYDDNIRIGMDFVDLYTQTKAPQFLDRAKILWKFVETGVDNIQGNSIYWCEQHKESKNACSNASMSIYALKLYTATADSIYFRKGLEFYNWTKKTLQDSSDYLYNDNISLLGQIDTKKYASNSGQMLQASALLYRITKDKEYLIEAQNIAKSCYKHFFSNYRIAQDESFMMLRNEDIWFTAVMFRGFFELYSLDRNKEFINAFQNNLNYAWNNMREENGLFNTDWSGQTRDNIKWLLTQFAMVEMYARISMINNKY